MAQQGVALASHPETTFTATTIMVPNVANLILPKIPPKDQHPFNVYIASLSTGSKRTMVFALCNIANLLSGGRCAPIFFNWGALRYQHTNAVRAVLAEKYAPATANKMLAALRGVLKAAWRLGQIPTNEYHRAIDLAPVRGETLPRGRALSNGELRALFANCAEDTNKDGVHRPVAARDAAVLAVLYGIGLRRSEVVAIDLADYDVESGELRVQNGKGKKARLAYAGRGVRDALAVWLQLRGSEAGPLFWPVLKSGRLVHRRLTDQAILTLLIRRAKRAGVKHCSPHDFRRTFISDLLDAGADISVVQKLAGHANVTTTTRYDRRGEIAKQKAAELLHVPFG